MAKEYDSFNFKCENIKNQIAEIIITRNKPFENNKSYSIDTWTCNQFTICPISHMKDCLFNKHPMKKNLINP